MRHGRNWKGGEESSRPLGSVSCRRASASAPQVLPPERRVPSGGCAEELMSESGPILGRQIGAIRILEGQLKKGNLIGQWSFLWTSPTEKK